MSVAQVLDAGEELLKAAIERSERFGDQCEVVFWRSAEDAWDLWCGQIPDKAANKPVVLVLVSAVSAGVAKERTQDLLSISSFLAYAVLRGLVSPARRWQFWTWNAQTLTQRTSEYPNGFGFLGRRLVVSTC